MRLWYDTVQLLTRAVTPAVFGIRCEGRALVPAEGGLLVLSNHQSHLDPILVGLACDRRLSYLARESLFGFAPLRWLMKSMNAIPIDREGTGLGGLRETLKRLKRGEAVVIFPEGTRTLDGQVAAIKPGFCALAKRGRVTLQPMAVDGAFDAWPRTSLFPRPAQICVQFGRPIPPDEVATFSDRELVAEVERRIRVCHDQARKRRLAVYRNCRERPLWRSERHA